ncbi:N-6 DNA methylase [Saccharopolyspora indica]|uniref:Eco57I restriction-modification methylase domain-containing protein n=1 Tax=Saccharopolyspora indica TaxID=1229659 RepID=UPI0022EA586E|nr:N-6 DNA methylase [Saccharopolyspora indica]MDA3647124.1 N-6 DNA methylase [Saccharopolyspora indica]
MSSIARNQVFSAVHTIGSLLPPDMLVRISEGKDISGSKPADYRVIVSRSIRDEAERHWDYLRSVWSELREKLPSVPQAEVPADPQGLAISQWLKPLFTELGFGALTSAGPNGFTSDDGTKAFSISHRWNHVPIHLTPWNSTLDRRGGGAVPPQSLVQEMLNRTDAHLWGVVTNGRQLRLLRDSNALATAAYVEFDLEAIFDGELFSEFVLLYRLLHVSRFEVADGAGPATCWLERWRLDAISSGTRALDQLRDGVEEAIKALGTGFLRHPANTALREKVDPQALHRALLRLVYRLLFVFVVEDRQLLHPRIDPKASRETREADELARKRYATYFSTAKLRAHARRRRGTAHDDLYRALRLVLDALGNDNGRPELALPGLGGIFDHTDTDTPLDGLTLSNEYLLAAVRYLCQVRDPASKRLRSVDYRHLDAEELGSIYESLLERVPKHSAVDREFSLVELAGNERKTTGSYYTPSSLIECLLDSTLDPVIDDAVKRGELRATAESNPDPTDPIVDELLSLTVCDPACGSGHFLLAAARRIAKRVASVRDRNPEPTVDSVREALHDVIARCIYGVDLNPMAIELAKVSLWLEAMEPGKPLSFLDAHLKVGNALIGATPALLRDGIPDKAFIPTEGDDKKVAKSLERRNHDERAGQLGLFDTEEALFTVSNTSLAEETARIMSAPAIDLAQIRAQAKAYADLANSADYMDPLRLANAWCATFVWIKTQDSPRAITHDVFSALEGGQVSALTETIDEIERLRRQYRFFHWHLEFPDVFTVPDSGAAETSGWSGGFDCVIGNPPWDSVQLKEQEFFAQRSPEIAAIGKSDVRKKMIDELRDDPDTQPLFRAYSDAKRQVYAESHFLRRSGRLPLTGQGNLNTYAVFAETARTVTGPRGRTGVIVPSGIATDARTQYFFKDLVSHRALTALYDFENRNGLFPTVDSRMKFCALSMASREVPEATTRFAFFLHDPAELDDPDKAFALTPEEITLLNPNTGTCPVFRSRRDAEIILGIYRRVPILIKEPDEHGQGGSNPWDASFSQGLFNMGHDARFFHTREDLERRDWILDGNVFTKSDKRMLPLYEAKMLHHYNHRWATYDAEGNVRTLDNKQNPDALVFPRYWVPNEDVLTGRLDKNGRPTPESGVATRLANKKWDREWLVGWRDICRSTDERTAIPALIPHSGVGHTLPIALLPEKWKTSALLIAAMSSFAFDFAARQKISGSHLVFSIIKQLPFHPPQTLEAHQNFTIPRALELTYTAHDMAPFARDLGDTGTPFRWDEERRSVIRAELDALFFHLYGISRDDTDYILDTFPIVKRKDEAKFGTYRTKDLILAEYDKMAEAGLTLETPLREGENYTSTVTPPPGHGPRHPEL